MSTETGLTLDEQANVDFVLYLRRRWADVVYPALAAELEAASGGAAPDAGSVADRTRRLPAYRWFAWLERGSQKMLWRAVSDVVAAHRSAAADDGAAAGEPELDPELELPDWYREWDIHVQPGGIWRNGAGARVYELGAKLVMLGENDDYAFHRSFSDTAIPRHPYRRIVDLGCGFGKSTWPLKQSYPDAEVVGIDLSAPCLRLARTKTRGLGLDIRLRQADARATGLDDGSCDLVTATMLVHEVPATVLPAIFAEAARILAPGGLLRVLDFHRTGQPLRDFAMEEHGERNNEPFMNPMMGADLTAMCAAAGLAGARWRAFDERGAGVLDGLEWPGRAEWHFPWAVLEAEKPT